MAVLGVVRRSYYRDSMVLMRLAEALRALPGVREAAALMGTPANHEILASAGLATVETKDAAPADLIIAIMAESDGAADAHLETLEANARRGGAKVRWLDADGLRREFPQFRRGRRALLEEEAGFLRATDCVTALRGLAEKHGVHFATGQDAAVARRGEVVA